MLFRQLKGVAQAFYALYADSGFSMAGAVAYSFVLSFFPFCIFLGTLAAYFGGEALAKQAVEQLFEMAPAPVAEAIAPEVMAVMGRSRAGLLTVGALVALFFATSAIESLRAALNVAYRVKERRSYFWCLMESALFVVLTAVGMLVLTWGVVVGPQVAARFKPDWLLWLADASWLSLLVRYAIVIAAIGSQLIAYHLWLAAGQRRLGDVWPGVVLSIALWVVAAQLFASWLTHIGLLALLCGAHADHERAGVLPGQRHHRHPRRRAEPGDRGGEEAAGGAGGDGRGAYAGAAVVGELWVGGLVPAWRHPGAASARQARVGPGRGPCTATRTSQRLRRATIPQRRWFHGIGAASSCTPVIHEQVAMCLGPGLLPLARCAGERRPDDVAWQRHPLRCVQRSWPGRCVRGEGRRWPVQAAQPLPPLHDEGVAFVVGEGKDAAPASARPTVRLENQITVCAA